MKLILESTSQIVQVEVGGVSVPGRVWEGITASGIAVQALITRVAVHQDDDNRQFEAELIEHPPRAPNGHAFDARLVL